MRVVGESRQGSAYARIRGVLEARRDAVCFLDDDNIPEPDYLEAGIRALDNPAVGLAVSRVRPHWEQPPPPSVSRRRHLLAINDYLGEAPRDFGADGTIAPTITAGMWVRRNAFLSAVPWSRPESLMAGRSGASLACGEDIEFGVLLGRAGYGRVYAPQLRVVHEIPRARLDTRYMRRLIEGIVRSELTLKEKYLGERVGIRTRMTALAQLVAAPFVALWRGDARREMAFIAAAAIARLKGPFRSPR